MKAVRASDERDQAALDVFTLSAEGDFSHLDHVRVARLYLAQLSLGAAIDRFCTDLRAYAAAKGAASKYHQTITVAFLLLIRSRLSLAPPGQTWDGFIEQNRDLQSARCLNGFYSPALLSSTAAAREFVFPDRAPSYPLRPD